MKVSLIIPVYNEEENLPLLFEALYSSLGALSQPWEIVMVDDGSKDQGINILKRMVEKDPDHVRVISFRRNFGQTAAIVAGMDYAEGDVIVLLDADLQNDPADISMLLEKLDEGYDVVSGWRKSRKDNLFTRTFPSVIANKMISWVTGVHLHDYGCTLKAYRREALEGVRLYGEMHRFIPVYAHAVGARITEVVVNHYPRRFGKTKYGLDRTLKVLLDLFTVKFLLSYSSKPIRLFGGTGLTFIFTGAMLLLYLFIRRATQQISVLGSPLFQLAVMFSILGFQSILMGLTAELLARTYHESQSKPIYTIKEIIQKKASK